MGKSDRVLAPPLKETRLWPELDNNGSQTRPIKSPSEVPGFVKYWPKPYKFFTVGASKFSPFQALSRLNGQIVAIGKLRAMSKVFIQCLLLSKLMRSLAVSKLLLFFLNLMRPRKSLLKNHRSAVNRRINQRRRTPCGFDMY